MSIAAFSNRGMKNKYLNPNARAAWVRNPSWLTLPSVTAADQKFVGLHSVYPDSNFLALSAAGNYTVDWGDGSATENISSGVTAYKIYDFTTVALANTNAPVTLTDSGDLVTRTSHGYSDGMIVRFYNIVSTTGLTDSQTYFVINSTSNTFQVSATLAGSAVALTTDGTATLLPYKQTIVTVTPQGGQNLTTLNLNLKHNQTNLSAYSSGFLDLKIAGTLMTSLLIGSSTGTSVAQNVSFLDLEKVNILSTAITSASFLFYNCTSLGSVEANTATVSNFSSMFRGCSALQTIPPINTAAGTNFGTMFGNCTSLQTIPLLNTVLGQTFTSMFTGCSSLQTIPHLNTVAGTNFATMFQSCFSLQSVPLLNTALGTSFTSMFNSCSSLQTIPLLNTAAGTTTAFNGMFNSCSSLQTIPLLNTASGTNFASMFASCTSLQTIPLLNTASGTTFTNMFSGCTILQSVPLLNTVLGTTFTNMFGTCISLQTIPLLNTVAGTNFDNMFNGCTSLQTIPLLNTAAGTSFSSMFQTCPSLQAAATSGPRYAISPSSAKLSLTALELIITNLGTVVGTPALTISTNWGAVTPVSLSGTTTAGSTTVTMASTTGITTGMQVTGVGTPSTTPIAVTMTDTGDTINLTAHGLSNTDEVSFATIVTTTGIVINTIYFVVGATANTFQVAATSGGAALPLTTNGSGTLRYKATVSSIVANVSVTLSRPATSSGTNTLSYRNLKTNTALLKGWSVTG